MPVSTTAHIRLDDRGVRWIMTPRYPEDFEAPAPRKITCFAMENHRNERTLKCQRFSRAVHVLPMVTATPRPDNRLGDGKWIAPSALAGLNSPQMKTPIAAIILLRLCNLAQGGEKLAANDFRIVNGVLYNIERSTNWFQTANLEVVKVIPSGLIMQSFKIQAPRVLGKIVGTQKEYGRKFLVLNSSNYTNAVDGAVFAVVVMSVGKTNIAEETIEVLDCGLPNTPENRRKLKINGGR